MNLKIKRELNSTQIEQAKKLYIDSFNDSKDFTDYYFNQYAKNNECWYLINEENEEVVLMAWLNKKRLSINNEKFFVGLIVAIAVKKEYQNKGIMKNFFNDWLIEIKPLYKYIFIQAYNWEIYKSFPFYECTVKKQYKLRKDQFLKPSELFEVTKYDLLNEIYNLFIVKNRIKNFTYKTKKENKLTLKMLEANGDKIYQNKKAYIIVSNETVVDFAFIDFLEFIKLLSNFPDLKINSYVPLDLKYFNVLNDSVPFVETKVMDYKNLNILFEEFF